MDLRNQLPGNTFQYIVTTDGNHLFTGTGSLITSLTVTSITSSQVTQSFISESFAQVGSLTAGYLTASNTFLTNSIVNNLTVSAILSTFRMYDGQNPSNDIAIFNTASTFVVSSSASPGAFAGFGNGVCFADNGFQSLGGFGYIDVDQTAGRAACWGILQNISSSVTTVTELGYVSGVTSSIQNQLNSKQGNLVVASTYQITASSAASASVSTTSLTSSYLIGATASAAPSNTSTPVAWINVTVSGSIYKLPLYQ